MYKRRIISILLSFALAVSCFLPMSITGFAIGERTVTQNCSGVNPIYDNHVGTGGKAPVYYSDSEKSSSPSYTKYDELVKYVRQCMVSRDTSIDFHYVFDKEVVYPADSNQLSPSFNAFIENVLEDAMKHTGVPDEGDYIKFQYKVWYANISYEYDPNKLDVPVKEADIVYNITYYTTADQESAVDNFVKTFKETHPKNERSSYDVLADIYKYVAKTVKYDYDRLNDDTYDLKYTAYAAALNKTAVCQGYALLFYRLALEYGFDSRIVTGNVNGVSHAWNIVKFGDKYYGADATWDASVQSDACYWFLLGSNNFNDHIMDVAFVSDPFKTAYPLSETDYNPDENTDLEALYLESDIKTSYVVNESINLDDITVKAVYANGNVEILKKDRLDISPVDMSTSGKKQLIISFGGKSIIVDIQVHKTAEKYVGGVLTEVIVHEYKDGLCVACNDEQIQRIAGNNRYDTAIECANVLKEKLGVDKFGTVIVAYGGDFADALGGAYLSAVTDAPILLVNNVSNNINKVLSYIDENLAAGGKVYLLGGVGVVSEGFESSLRRQLGISDSDDRVERLAGSNRYVTNMAVLKEAYEITGHYPKEILVVDGGGYADALSVSATGRAILMINKNKTDIYDYQKEYLGTINTDTDIIAIGGTGAVPEALCSGTVLGAYDTANGVERVAGLSRYNTSLAVADRFFEKASADTLILAYGNDYPDGLCAGPLAYAVGSPLILTRDVNISLVKEHYADNRIVKEFVLGGPTLISDAAVNGVINS